MLMRILLLTTHTKTPALIPTHSLGPVKYFKKSILLCLEIFRQWTTVLPTPGRKFLSILDRTVTVLSVFFYRNAPSLFI